MYYWLRFLAIGTASVVLLAAASGVSLAAPSAPHVRLEIASNGGGNRLDVMVRVTTSRPNKRCSGEAALGKRSGRLPTLRTGRRGGRQWHWVLGDGAPRANLRVRVQCRFPNGRLLRTRLTSRIGPGPYPRRAFRELMRGLVRDESWAPAKRYDGSGGDASLYPRGQCTWYVAKRRPDLPYFPGRAGDARNWITAASARKLPIGDKPVVGAVAVFQPGQYKAGYYGHVAFVESIDGEYMRVSEANFGGRRPGAVRRTPWRGIKFIYKTAPIDPPVRVVGETVAPVTPPAPPVARGPVIWPEIDLLTGAGVKLAGSGTRVTSAGDMNGDGYDDVAVGDPYASNGRRQAGAVFVVFGGPLGGLVSMSSLGSRGFRIDGAVGAAGARYFGDQAGDSVAPLGDVNRDGLDDLAVGASLASNNGREAAGAAYVVFGSRNPGTLDLADLGTRGFRIDGEAAWFATGRAVAGPGDVNRDGLPDIAIGAADADNNGRAFSGSVYIVFGKADTSSVDLAGPGFPGFRVDGEAPGDGAGLALGPAGDTNGDGAADILIGAPGRTTLGGPERGPGRAYVVFGKAGQERIDLTLTDENSGKGFRINGASPTDHTGADVDGGVDVNGDGLPDLVIGAPGADNNARANSGSIYVLFGRRDSGDVNLGRLGTGGLRFDGPETTDGFGPVRAAGDFNRDGLADVVAGMSSADFRGRVDAGSAIVAFGRREGGVVDLADIGSKGVLIGGAADQDAAGFAVSGGGDFNGDGRQDILLTSPFADLVLDANETKISGGAAYVVFGRDAPP